MNRYGQKTPGFIHPGVFICLLIEGQSFQLLVYTDE